MVNHDPMGLLQKVECFLLDMDGTVYLEDHWIEGALDFLRILEERGICYYFLTNNSSKGIEDYVTKLERMGLSLPKERIIGSGEVTAAYVKKHYAQEPVYLMGNASLQRQFVQMGIPLVRSAKEAALLVTGFDTELNYQKLCEACTLIRAGRPYIATHLDINCPVRDGFVPDIGAMEACLFASTGRHPDVVLGKPHEGIIEYALQRACVQREHTAMVGDRLYTDIPAGIRNGLLSVFVLSGEGKLRDLPRYSEQPHLIFDSVKEMIPLLKG